MSEKFEIFKDVPDEFLNAVRWIASGLIQIIFIVLWVIMQWAVKHYVIVPYASGAEGADKYTLAIAQWLFSISTLTPIILFVLRQIITMLVRTYRGIRQDIEEELTQ